MKQNILLFILILLISGCSQKEIEPSFSLQEETGSITLASAANSQTVISFTSTREWKASTSSEWLLISPTSGEAGTYQMALTASSKNNNKNSRTATVNLVSAGLTQSFTVTQSPAEYVELEQTAYYTEAQGGSLQIKFTTNLSTDELAIYGTVSWLTQPANSRTDQAYVVNLTVLPNEEEKERTAYLYFCKTNGEEEEEILNSVTIIQEGTDTNTSTDYSADKTVRILQRATQGNGLPIVLMGDGFLDTDIANGTYDEVMNKAMENLFTEEPLKSLQSYFNVYYVTAVSRSNKFDGYNTAFQCQMEGGMSTLITGNDENVIDYIQCVEGIDVSETLAVVVLNSPLYAGTTYFGYYSESQVTELAIAYCPIIYDLENDSFRQVLVHEAVGHGFAKLEDEYSYEENGKMPSDEINDVKMLQSYGWAQNVDFTQDENTILWSSFLNDSRYSSEGIGIYEGACTYMSGVYRPTEDSMMNTNTCGFNAPSRKAIYDMVMKRGENRETTYEEFADFDSRNVSQVQTLTRTSNAISRPFTRPHFVHKSINK